jgi:hypothetical protein
MAIKTVLLLFAWFFLVLEFDKTGLHQRSDGPFMTSTECLRELNIPHNAEVIFADCIESGIDPEYLRKAYK